MVEVYAVNVGQTMTKAMFERLAAFLPENRQERLRRFRRPEDAKASLLAELLVRAVIRSRLGIGMKEIGFIRNEYGKPHLDSCRDLHFNVSHSGIWAVCAVHHMPVGIDVEKVQPIDFNIARRFFSEKEYSDLMNRESGQRLSCFYELWTLKESYIKAVGKGLSIPLDSFSFRLQPGRILFECNEGCESYYFKQYNIDDGYKTAVCGRMDDFPGEVEIRELEDLCNGFLLMGKQ